MAVRLLLRIVECRWERHFALLKQSLAVARSNNGTLAAAQGGTPEATFDREECVTLLELVDTAAQATRAMEPIFATNRGVDRKWWRVLPQVEQAHARLTKALDEIGPMKRSP